jgi:hypothetical protein
MKELGCQATARHPAWVVGEGMRVSGIDARNAEHHVTTLNLPVFCGASRREHCGFPSGGIPPHERGVRDQVY